MERAKKTSAQTWLYRLYLFLMLTGLPLVVHDGFFDITETKTLFFAVASVAFVLVRLGTALYRSNGLPRPHLRAAEAACLVFCGICLVSSLCAESFAESFLGTRGRWQGAGMMWLYAALFFSFIGINIKPHEVILPLSLGLLLSGLLAVCNHLGWDILGLCSQLTSHDAGRYISTLGNINFAGAYITLALSAAAAACLTEERLPVHILLGAVCITGTLAAMAVRSESAVLGIGAGTVLLPLFAGNLPKALRRYPLFLAVEAASVLVYRLIVFSRGKALSSLTEYLTHPFILLSIIVLGTALFLFFRKKEDKTVCLVRRIYGFALLGVFLLGTAALVLLNTVWSAVPLGGLDNWVHFSASWGTDRGKVWSYCVSLFADFPLWEKLIGGGCGILASLDVQHRLFSDAVLDTAHCEYLQILLNWGLLGLSSYLAWIILTVRDAVRNGGRLSFVLAFGLTIYAVQASVNIAQAPGISVFFVLLAVLRGKNGSDRIKVDIEDKQ